MAECIRIEPALPEYELKLSYLEASILVKILARVGGPVGGLRGYTDAIYNALVNAGVRKYDCAIDEMLVLPE